MKHHRFLLAALGLVLALASPAAALQISTPPGSGGGGSGTVTTVSVVTANGVSGSVANPTTHPAITLSLGAITPTSVAVGGATIGTDALGVTGTSTLGGTLNLAPAVNTNALKVTGYSLTGTDTHSLIDLAGTLNTSGSPDVFALRITDTARGASTKFFNIYGGASGTTSEFSIDRTGNLFINGVYGVTTGSAQLNSGNASSITTLAGGGTPYLNTLTTYLNISGSQFGMGSVSAPDVIIARDAANTLAQRNGVNAQTLRVYNTFTDASNGEWLSVDYSSIAANLATIATKANGTGSARNLAFSTPGSIFFYTGGTGTTQTWSIQSTGHILATTDNTYDIGANGATRPRNLYLGSSGRISGDVEAVGGMFAATSSAFSAGAGFKATVANQLTLLNWALSDAPLVQWGGTTSSFPALKRSTTILQVRLADDSAYAPLEASTLRTSGFTVAGLPAAGTAGRKAYVTDQLTTCAVAGAALTGGGAVVCPVFDNGSAWVGD